VLKTMRVRLTTDRATMTDTHEAGEVIDLPQAEAEALIRTEQAEPVDAKPPGAIKRTAK